MNKVALIEKLLREQADSERARREAAYLKTTLPVLGVPVPKVRSIVKEVLAGSPISSAAEYQELVTALWRHELRDMKKAAIHVACLNKKYIVPDHLPLYEMLIREGAWWDFVDEVAGHIIVRLVLAHPEHLLPIMYQWNEDPDMWIRRTSIICQIHAKHKTNQEALFELCLRRAHEKEFFIRKAIGWALRDYAETAPEAVWTFAHEHKNKLSPLSFREAIRKITSNR